MHSAHPLRWLVLFGVWFIYGAFGLVATSLAPLVPLIESDLGMSHAAMGSVMGAWQLVYIAAAVPCGILLDRLGSRWALLLGASFVAASAYGRSIAGDYGELLFAVMLFGIGGPIISAGAPKVITTWFHGASRGLAMGIYITGPAIGGALSLSLTHAWLLPHFDGDWRRIFALWAGLAGAAGVAWWLLASLPGVRPIADERHAIAHTPHRQVIAGLLEVPAVRLVLLMSVGMFLIGHGLNNWLPELLVTGGMDVVEAGYWAAIPTVVGIAGSLLIPRLATPERRLQILTVLCVTVVASTLLLHFSARPLLLTGLILQGIARSSLMTVLILALVELPSVGARNAGTASGLFFAAGEMGGMLGPLGLGVLYDLTHGFGAGLTLLTAIAIALLVGIHRLRLLAQA